MLTRLGAWSTVPAGLAEFAQPQVRNTQKKIVGEVRCAVPWPDEW